MSNFSANTVGVYSIDDGQRTNMIQVGDGPDALAFSSAGNLVLVANSPLRRRRVIRHHQLLPPRAPEKSEPYSPMLPAAKHPNAIAVKAFQMP